MTSHRKPGRGGWRKVSAGVVSGSTLLLIGGVWGTGAAQAGDAPEPNTPECTKLVDADVAVKAAVAAQVEAAGKLNLLPATDPGFEAAAKAVADAGVKLDEVRAKATIRLCTGTEETTTPTTTTTAPPTSVTTDPTPPIYADVKDCADFTTRQEAQDYYDAHTTPADPDPSKLDADGDGVVCEVNEVNPRGGGTGGGTQVRVWPLGGVETGDGSTEPGMS